MASPEYHVITNELFYTKPMQMLFTKFSCVFLSLNICHLFQTQPVSLLHLRTHSAMTTYVSHVPCLVTLVEWQQQQQCVHVTPDILDH